MFHDIHVRILLTTGQMDLEIVRNFFCVFKLQTTKRIFWTHQKNKVFDKKPLSLHKLRNASNKWNVLSQTKSLDCGPQHESLIMRAQVMLNTTVIDVVRSCWESGISDLSLRACRTDCTEYKRHEWGQESDCDKWRRFQGVRCHSLWCTPMCPGWPLLYALWMKICILMAEFKWGNNFLNDWALPWPPCWSVVPTYSNCIMVSYRVTCLINMVEIWFFVKDAKVFSQKSEIKSHFNINSNMSHPILQD